MKKHFIFAVLFLLACTKPNTAQEPRWELFARNFAGVIAVDPTNSDVIYISPGEPGMWKTTDRGQSWNLYRNGWGLGQTLDLLLDPINPAAIWASGGPFVGILKSSDGGQNWFRADTGLVPDHHGYMVGSLALDNQRRLFYTAHQAISGGVHRSSDGVRWQNLTPLNTFDTMKIIVDERTGVLYVAGFNGVWKSLDGGNNWIQIGNDFSAWHVVKVKDSNTLYAATGGAGIYKSFDGGDNWFSANDSVTSKLSFRGGLVVAEKDTNTIYAGVPVTSATQPGGLYLSRNGGNSWVLYKFGLPDSTSDFFVRNIFLDNRANVLYASIFITFRGSGRSESNIYRLLNAVPTSVTERRHPGPTQLALYSYPNPLSSQTSFVYSTHKKGQVLFRLFDILGKEVVTLLNEQRSLGEYRISWGGTNAEGRRLPSGIYIARLQLGEEVKTIKVLLLQ